MTTQMADIVVGTMIPDHVMAEIVQVLHRRQGTIITARVRDVAEREWARYDEARVRAFIPLLVQRAVVDQILAAGVPQ